MLFDEVPHKVAAFTYRKEVKENKNFRERRRNQMELAFCSLMDDSPFTVLAACDNDSGGCDDSGCDVCQSGCDGGDDGCDGSAG